MRAHLAMLWGAFWALGAGAARAAEPTPVDFRCDSMTVHSAPNRSVGRRHVVIRQGDLLLCCDRVETAADPLWQWQSMICQQRVRAQRGDEVVWADRAEFSWTSQAVVLTGRPVLRRGATWLTGERITFRFDDRQARIARPRGHLPGEAAAASDLPSPLWLGGPLPERCPIAPRG